MQRLSYAAMLALTQSKAAGKDASVFICDVRGADEVASTGGIPFSVNVPLDQLDTALSATAEDFVKTYKAAKPQTGDRVVTYCLKGMRAEKAAGIFTAKGYTNVDVYPGSWSEWAEHNKKAE